MSAHLFTLIAQVRTRILRSHGERAASLVEYALLLALIAMVCVAAVSTLGTATSNSFNSAANLL